MSEQMFGPVYPAIRLVHTELVSQVAEGTPTLCDPESARAELSKLIGMKDREYCAVLHLNSRHQVTSGEIVSIGTINSSLVHPREVFKAAILANARAFICAHNHPSGDVAPSDDDLALLRRLGSAADILGIPLLDFLVVAGEKVWSARDVGIISGITI